LNHLWKQIEGLLAYIQEGDFDENNLNEITAKYQDLTTIAATWKSLERRNWNEEWEKSYEPIEVGDQIRVRATFHEPDPAFKYDLLIQPKMSFGTGHHETTWLVMNEQLSLPHEVFGDGCGLRNGNIGDFGFQTWSVKSARLSTLMNGPWKIPVKISQ
jgi:ribosomal protein L11 methyltransferase